MKRLLCALAATAVSFFYLPPVIAAGNPISFATPTIVDPYRPGFEPDVAIDRSPSGKGATYTSTPFGFSTTESFVYRSDDDRQSFHLTEGNALGKTTACIGGGDTELQIDPVNGALYFADLQGLTNFSTSTSSDQGATWTTTCDGVNGAGVDRQWIGIDSNGGMSAVGDGPDGGRVYLDYDNVAQNTDATNTFGNQLVMNESLDGVHYGGQCQAAGAPCPLPPAVISNDEGIPGNVVVDNNPGSPFQHRIYAVHTNGAGNAITVSSCSGAQGDDTAAKVAADCTDPTQVMSSDPAHVNVFWKDTFARAPGQYLTGNLFGAIAVDRAGNLYAVWSEYPVDMDGNENGPGVVKLAVSTDGAQTWSQPFAVSPDSLGNNVMPWIAAGDAGRIDIAWYGASQAANAGGAFGPDTLDAGTWNVYLAQSLDATSGKPSFTVTQVSDHQAKFGNISTQGLGGSPDRSLGDYMQVTVGPQGQAVVSYVDDTSADRNPDFCQGCGETTPEAAGPIMIATQNGGPSLFSAVGTVAAPPRAVGSVSDPTGDSFLSLGGSRTPAPPALDITGASVAQLDPDHLQVTLTTADPNLAQDLAFDPSLGGPVGEWIVRWAAPADPQTPGDGNIFYVGMESSGGGAPEFYMGTTGAIQTTHAKFFTYPKTTDIPGAISGNTITWTVPLSNDGSGPAPGGGLFSITAFTATQLTPSQASATMAPNGSTLGDEDIPNTLDLSPPFSPNHPPVAALAATPATGLAPLTVNFDGSGSSDPDTGDTIAGYTFDFGDGSGPVTQATPTISHVYNNAGSFRATLTVTDSHGAVSSNTAEQVIKATETTSLPPPSSGTLAAHLTADPLSGPAPLAVSFDAGGSTGTITSYAFDFGDGNKAGPQATPTASHTYTQTGSFSASVVVTDSQGNTASQAVVITVTAGGTSNPVLPAASLAVSPANGDVGNGPVTVSFDGGGSHDPDGDAIASYTFDFGDNSGAVTRSVAQMGAGAAQVTHPYDAAGTYRASLTVTDSRGQVSDPVFVTLTMTGSVSVTPPGGPVAALKLGNNKGPAPLTVSFDGSPSFDRDGNKITQYTFDFGDGSAIVTRTVAAFGVNAPLTSHVYALPGTYTPSLTVTNDQGVVSAPAKADANVVATKAGGSGGGALGWMTLLPLLGVGLARRCWRG